MKALALLTLLALCGCKEHFHEFDDAWAAYEPEHVSGSE
jgi:hypothetical protein